MNWLDTVVKRPIYTFVFWLLVVVLGLMGFYGVPRDLFPDTTPPQVAVVTTMRGASADDVNRLVTTILDREIKGISGLKKVTATSKDEISSINAEFHYEKDLGEAVNDVLTAVSKARRQFPAGVDEPQLFRITEANRPLLTLAVRAKDPGLLDLIGVRQVVENDLKERILRLPGIGRVDVFGAHEAEVAIRFDHGRLREYDLNPEAVLTIIGASNLSVPGGYQETPEGETLVRTLSEAVTPQQLGRVPIRVARGGIVRLADVASVSLAMKTPRSIYHGQGEPAIAMNVLKPEGGNSLEGILAVKNAMPALQEQFPHLAFSFTTDQQPIIDKNFAGMTGSLFSAIWLTMVIVFVMLLEWRTALIIGISIPCSFLTTFAYLFFSGYTLNMVTLSGLIIAVGMVVDASIVVVENIFRRVSEGEPGETAVPGGTSEVVFSIFGGMLTTIVVLVPLMFTGGYVQRTLRPLSLTISTTLIGSFLAALTIVPILMKWFFGTSTPQDLNTKTVFQKLMRPLEVVVTWVLDSIAEAYLWLLRLALNLRVVVLLGCLAAFVFTVKLAVPLVGNELMPRMDTGMLTIRLDLPPRLTHGQCEKVLGEVEAILKREPDVLDISSVMGAEAGQISFGAGGQLLQQAEIQVRLTTRDQRAKTIWDFMSQWREELGRVPLIVSASITEFGATPLSTTRAPIDVMLVGRDPRVLDGLAGEMLDRLRQIKGLRDLRRQWAFTKPETVFHPDLAVAAQLGVTPKRLGDFLQMVFSGRIATKLKMAGFLDLPVRVDLGFQGRLWQETLGRLFVLLPGMDIDLANLGRTERGLAATMLTRENLEQTLDLLGINADRPISAVAADVKKVIEGFPFPPGYSARLTGTPADMAEAGERRGVALKPGLVFLYLVLLLLFETWWQPLVVMATIPLALIWGFWGLVIFDKPMCLPALNGFILLGGTIVNNAIILIDFIEQARGRGIDKREALFDSVRVRLRPIFITTFSTVLGLLPLTFEQAVGLERLSPLGVVASCGLTGGTLMTLVIIPVLYDLVTDWGTWLQGRFGRLFGNPLPSGKPAATTTVAVVAGLLIAATGFAQGLPDSRVDDPSHPPLVASAEAPVTIPPEPVPFSRELTMAASGRDPDRTGCAEVPLGPTDGAPNASLAQRKAAVVQATDPCGKTLSVQECLDLSQKNSPLLESMEAERLGAVGARQEAGAAARPQIDTAGAWRQWDRKRVGMLGIAPTERQFYDHDLTEFRLTLRQLLWDGNQTGDRKTAAGLNVKSKEAQLQRTRDEVAADVLVNALGVFTAEALLEAADKTLVDIRATLAKMEAMEAVGRVPHVDVLRIQARVQEVLETQEGFRQTRANILARLSSLVGCRESIGGLTPEGLPAYSADLASDPEALVQAALSQRADLAALRYAVAGGKRAETAQRHGKNPQVFLNATVNRYGDRTGWGREIGFVGAEFQWTLEDGGRNRGKTTQATAQRQAAEARLRQAELKAAEQVRTVCANLRSARVRLERNQANLTLAEEAFRIERAKYEQGKGTINDVLDAESAMFQAQGQVIRSRNELLAAQIALDLAVR
ncbi:MAG: TolC family protein [Candidatus Riflebacteria bacterium]|nr:TolC family protein [Candidatus Riflebacteria bacterium]